MERELWPLLYHELQAAARDVRQRSVQHQPWAIAAVLVWAALHDRTVTWACQPRHWSTTRLRPACLPSQPTVSRRVRRTAFGLFLNVLTDRLRGAGLPALALAVDGKPLLVGGCSKDPDARFGRAAGHVGRGYKLHAIWGIRPLPEAWEVAPLNVCEKAAAGRLVGQLAGGGYLLADGNYDASPLYDTAAARGYQLVAPCRKAKAPGCGKHYQSPYRQRSLAVLGAPLGAPFGTALRRRRTAIERAFGNATAFAGGLGPLPAWVRRPWRVGLWVWAKLAINAARIRYRQGLVA
jgi:hypothetical protein